MCSGLNQPHWLWFYLRLLLATLSEIPLCTPLLKAESSLISPGCTSIKLLSLEMRFSIPSYTQSILHNEMQPFYYNLYGLKLSLPEIFSWLDILQVSVLQPRSPLKMLKRERGFPCIVMNWTVFPPNSNVEGFIPDKTVFRDRVYKEVINVKWGHSGEP